MHGGLPIRISKSLCCCIKTKDANVILQNKIKKLLRLKVTCIGDLCSGTRQYLHHHQAMNTHRPSDEVRKAIQKIQKGKVAGENGINANPVRQKTTSEWPNNFKLKYNMYTLTHNC